MSFKPSLKKADLAKAKKAGDRLCASVAAWVKAVGGNPVVVGGISIMRYPDEGEFNFRVLVRVTGRTPDFSKYEFPAKPKRKANAL